jgi:hypothetical protein
MLTFRLLKLNQANMLSLRQSITDLRVKPAHVRNCGIDATNAAIGELRHQARNLLQANRTLRAEFFVLPRATSDKPT